MECLFFYYEILMNQIYKIEMNFKFRVRADESLYAFILLVNYYIELR